MTQPHTQGLKYLLLRQIYFNINLRFSQETTLDENTQNNIYQSKELEDLPLIYFGERKNILRKKKQNSSSKAEEKR